MVGDRLAEGRALLRIAKRGLERGLRQADARRRGAEPRDLEDRRSLLESTTGRTVQSILRRNAAALEAEPARLEPAQPEGRLGPIGAEAGHPGADDE